MVLHVICFVLWQELRLYFWNVYSSREWYFFRLPDEPNLGKSMNGVIRIIKEVLRKMNHKIFLDNYYTSIPLIVYLKEQGILA